MSIHEEQHGQGGPLGSLDGDGEADHDQPYRFGWRPRTSVPYPFSTRQYARLLVFRSRLEERRDWQSDFSPAA
jgi:hypothetical protein